MDKFKEWLKNTWQKIVNAYKTIPWLKWVTIVVAAVVLVMAIAIPATSGGDGGRREPISSSESSVEESVSDSEESISSEEESSSEEPAGCQHEWLEMGSTVTCTAPGFIINGCMLCGELETKMSPPYGHDYMDVAKIEPTCTTTGVEANRRCKNCSAYESELVEIEELGHEFADGACSRCGEVESQEGLEYAHGTTGYIVTGIGTVTDEEIVISSMYKGEKVHGIEAGAFKDCTQLKKVTISVSYIGSNAFDGCTSLGSIVVTEAVREIGSYAFSGTPFYRDPSNWESGALYLGEHLIATNSNLAEVYTVKAGTKYISEAAFHMNTKLQKVTIPASVVSIGYNAFSHCTSLTSFSVDAENVSYASADGKNLYSKDKKTLIMYAPGQSDTEFTVPETVEVIGDYAFSDFANNNKDEGDVLMNVVLPETLKTIGVGAFQSRESLIRIVIPASVSSIAYNAFAHCSNLKEIEFKETNGWTATKVSASPEIVTIAPTQFADVTAVATMFKETYRIYNWKRD